MGFVNKCEAEKLLIDSLKAQLAQCQQEKSTLSEQLAIANAALAVCGELNRTLNDIIDTLKAKIDKFEGKWPDITFEPYAQIDQRTVDWCKDEIVSAGFAHLMLLSGAKHIRIVDDVSAYVPNTVPNVLAGCLGDTIYAKPLMWLPGWDLPGTIIHEAVHLWQMDNGLTVNSKGMEIQAYSIQQIFEWRYCRLYNLQPRNIFKERPGAIGLL